MAGDAVAPVALGACDPRAAIKDIAVSRVATEDDKPIVELMPLYGYAGVFTAGQDLSLRLAV